ncbi:MAG: hypothetical protein C3F13_09140 [Anaerolineales bacterium]|nr:hypothetical protein [Anaerolineae bacterium]PWB53563.1 MAG: hypothetical protein C3F13_09140 [Anaerolineales bacterium]
MKGIVLALFVIFLLLGAGVAAASSTTVYLPIASNMNTPTPTPNLSPILFPNGDFEQGATIWVESSTQGYELILEQYPYGLPATIPPYNGRWVAWLGFVDIEYSTISQQILVPYNHPYLSYWIWIDSEDPNCGIAYDLAQVTVNGATVDEYYLCTATKTNGWVQRVVDLHAYRGETVEIKFGGFTDLYYQSGLFIDHVTFQVSEDG